ncbi:MAG: hypothetical protein KDB46_08465 [Solirubrobacterales bacterium]|nr:hypothetical protein [Solirubrobacterales bacterium]
MESESHSHEPLRTIGAAPVAHPRDDELERLEDGPHAHAPTAAEVAGWKGDSVTDENGHHVGRVEAVCEIDGRAEWLVVRHHLSHHLLAPVAGAIGGGGRVMLPFEAARIGSAPGIEPGTQPSPELIESARAYYGNG